MYLVMQTRSEMFSKIATNEGKTFKYKIEGKHDSLTENNVLKYSFLFISFYFVLWFPEISDTESCCQELEINKPDLLRNMWDDRKEGKKMEEMNIFAAS
jgi:hypothetical protein